MSIPFKKFENNVAKKNRDIYRANSSISLATVICHKNRFVFHNFSAWFNIFLLHIIAAI